MDNDSLDISDVVIKYYEVQESEGLLSQDVP